MEMSHLASKLKALKLELSEDLLVHLVLISLLAQFNQFKVSYNCLKDSWSLNKLISHYVTSPVPPKTRRKTTRERKVKKLRLRHRRRNNIRNRLRMVVSSVEL